MNPWCITKGKSNILVSYRFGQSVSTIFHSFRLRELLTGVQQMLNFIIVYGLLSSLHTLQLPGTHGRYEGGSHKNQIILLTFPFS